MCVDNISRVLMFFCEFLSPSKMDQKWTKMTHAQHKEENTVGKDDRRTARKSEDDERETTGADVLRRKTTTTERRRRRKRTTTKSRSS